MVIPSAAPAVPAPAAEIGAALVRELQRRFPQRTVTALDDPGGGAGLALVRQSGAELRVVRTCWPDPDGRAAPAVLVSGAGPEPHEAVVAAAVDDDASPGRVVRCAAEQARRAGTPLRVVHVWTGRPRPGPCPHIRRGDDFSDADRLLSAVLYDNLPQDQAGRAEREILHDPEAVPALIALSTHAALIVVAAASWPSGAGGPLGETVRALAGRTACPLAVLAPEGGATSAARAW
jgi:universal stress protein family protein